MSSSIAIARDNVGCTGPLVKLRYDFDLKRTKKMKKDYLYFYGNEVRFVVDVEYPEDNRHRGHKFVVIDRITQVVKKGVYRGVALENAWVVSKEKTALVIDSIKTHLLAEEV